MKFLRYFSVFVLSISAIVSPFAKSTNAQVTQPILRPRPTRRIPQQVPRLRLPDLVVEVFEVGSPIEEDNFVRIPVVVRVKNQGDAPANVFKVSIDYTLGNRSAVGASQVPGQPKSWYPFTSSALAAGASVTFQGTLTANNWQGETVTNLTAKADSCSGDEFMPDYCRVREFSETNNTRSILNVGL